MYQLLKFAQSVNLNYLLSVRFTSSGLFSELSLTFCLKDAVKVVNITKSHLWDIKDRNNEQGLSNNVKCPI